jgi:hypothetical protein
MTSKTKHYVHLNIKDIRLSDIKFYENTLDLLNHVIDDDTYVQFITFDIDTQVIYDTFTEIIFTNHQYVTTFEKVKKFIDKCLTNYHEQTKNYFDNEEIFRLVYMIDIPDDTIVTIEFEES